MTIEVHFYYGVPFLRAHVENHPVSEDAGIVDQDIKSAKGVNGGLDDVLTAFSSSYGIIVGDRFTTCILNLIHHEVSGFF